MSQDRIESLLIRQRYNAMDPRAAIIAEALTWEGTPYHHQACVKGVGVDCAMLLVGIARGCGRIPTDWWPVPYSPEWHYHQTTELLEQTILGLGGQKLHTIGEAPPGAILLFRFGAGQPMSHAGIVLPGAQLIHAVAPRAVIRHGLRGRWRRAVVAAYDFPGGQP